MIKPKLGRLIQVGIYSTKITKLRSRVTKQHYIAKIQSESERRNKALMIESMGHK